MGEAQLQDPRRTASCDELGHATSLICRHEGRVADDGGDVLDLHHEQTGTPGCSEHGRGPEPVGGR